MKKVWYRLTTGEVVEANSAELKEERKIQWLCDLTDGRTIELEMDDELFAIHYKMVQEEKRNHWQNTRRHISLNYLNQHEIDIEAADSNPLCKVLADEEADELRELMLAVLSKEQQELIKKVFFDDIASTEIARLDGVGKSAISNRLARIYKKLLKAMDYATK